MHRNQQYTQRERCLYSWPAESSYEPEFNTVATTPAQPRETESCSVRKIKERGRIGSSRVESSRVESSGGGGGVELDDIKVHKTWHGQSFCCDFFFFFSLLWFCSLLCTTLVLLRSSSAEKLTMKNKLKLILFFLITSSFNFLDGNKKNQLLQKSKNQKLILS
jgi:hypothetical protein